MASRLMRLLASGLILNATFPLDAWAATTPVGVAQPAPPSRLTRNSSTRWTLCPGVERSTRAALQGAADGFGLALEIVSARAESEFEAAFARMAALKTEALLVTTDPLFMGGRGSLVGLAARHAVPTSYPWREFVDVGGLISYGPSLTEAYRQVGVYAGKILGGESPADLPVMQPTTFELVVNLKTAKQLGLLVPLSILGRADEVVE